MEPLRLQELPGNTQDPLSAGGRIRGRSDRFGGKHHGRRRDADDARLELPGFVRVGLGALRVPQLSIGFTPVEPGFRQRGVQRDGTVVVRHGLLKLARIEIRVAPLEGTVDRVGLQSNRDRVIFNRLVELTPVVVGQTAVAISQAPCGSSEIALVKSAMARS